LSQAASAHYNQSQTGTGKNSFSNKITLLCSTLAASGYEIRFLWVSGHQNIPGNEMADKLPKLHSPHRKVFATNM